MTAGGLTLAPPAGQPEATKKGTGRLLLLAEHSTAIAIAVIMLGPIVLITLTAFMDSSLSLIHI